MFSRKLDTLIIDELQKSSLWKNKLKADCEKQEVFFAIRNDSIGFYHKGSRLFEFDKNGFKTHHKFASAIGWEKDYLSETDLSSIKPITNFEEGYSRIKENCANYSGVEAQGVSSIYHKHSYLSNENKVVLDIEVSFESQNKDKRQDRIDILLLDKNKKTLEFVEAKHFSNSEIWSSKTPKVIGQIRKYQNQISSKKADILSAYTHYTMCLNKIFDIDLPIPIDITPNVMLLIFGFDKNQKDGRLKELITENTTIYEGINCFAKGDVSKIDKWNPKIIK
jgi:hypothetical protein